MSNKHSSEQFHSNLIEQYKDMIHEAILECETDCKTHLNVEALDKRLQNIVISAKCDGISSEEIVTLIDQVKEHSSYAKKVA